jgi:hypothetical protein
MAPEQVRGSARVDERATSMRSAPSRSCAHGAPAFRHERAHADRAEARSRSSPLARPRATVAAAIERSSPRSWRASGAPLLPDRCARGLAKGLRVTATRPSTRAPPRSRFATTDRGHRASFTDAATSAASPPGRRRTLLAGSRPRDFSAAPVMMRQ